KRCGFLILISVRNERDLHVGDFSIWKYGNQDAVLFEFCYRGSVHISIKSEHAPRFPGKQFIGTGKRSRDFKSVVALHFCNPVSHGISAKWGIGNQEYLVQWRL